MKEMVTYFSILAWKITWTEEPGGLQSLALQRVRHDLSNLAQACTYRQIEREAGFVPPRCSIGEGNGTPLQYSCLENPMDGGAWQAAVHGVAKSWTRLSNFPFTFTFIYWRRKWQPTPVLLPGESQGRGNLVGFHLWSRIESDMTEMTQLQQMFHIGN